MFVTARFLVIASVACATLAACDDAPEKQASSAPANQGSQLPVKAAGVPAEMVAAVSSGNVASAISVHFDLEAPPALGTALPVEIAIVPHRKFTLVRAQFTAPDGLLLSEGSQFEHLREAKAETILNHRLVLQPTREGIYLISVVLETYGEDGNITRTYSIPVIVDASAPATQPSAAPAPATPAG